MRPEIWRADFWDAMDATKRTIVLEGIHGRQRLQLWGGEGGRLAV